jgi:hypothetical protein
MDVAALSMGMANVNLAQHINMALTEKIMDTSEVQTNDMIKLMEQSVNPQLGGNIDIKI